MQSYFRPSVRRICHLNVLPPDTLAPACAQGLHNSLLCGKPACKVLIGMFFGEYILPFAVCKQPVKKGVIIDGFFHPLNGCDVYACRIHHSTTLISNLGLIPTRCLQLQYFVHGKENVPVLSAVNSSVTESFSGIMVFLRPNSSRWMPWATSVEVNFITTFSPFFIVMDVGSKPGLLALISKDESENAVPEKKSIKDKIKKIVFFISTSFFIF